MRISKNHDPNMFVMKPFRWFQTFPKRTQCDADKRNLHQKKYGLQKTSQKILEDLFAGSFLLKSKLIYHVPHKRGKVLNIPNKFEIVILVLASEISVSHFCKFLIKNAQINYNTWNILNREELHLGQAFPSQNLCLNK